jgi:hypothetical protein
MALKIFTKSGKYSRGLEKKDRRNLGSTLKYRNLPSIITRATGPKSSRFSGLNEWFQDSWVLEYVCVGFSIVCLIAILATLFSFDGLPLAAWHSAFSINTILSILGTGMKGSALLAAASALGQLKWAWYCHPNRPLQDFQTFDNASRGPYGAFLLLLRVPYSNLACIGALVTLMSLASDAFVQASIYQPLRAKYVQNATVPVCHDYEFTYLDSTVDPSLKAALYAGIFNVQATDVAGVSWALNTSGSISPLCPTGNCTFPPYSSLAVRHQCSNVTEMLQLSTQKSPYSQTASLQIPKYNQTLTAVYFDDYQNSTQGDFTTVLNMTSGDLADYLYFYNASYGDVSADGLHILDTYMVTLDFGPNNFQAFHCNLRFGMQTYTASVSKGIFVETPGDFIPGNWTLFAEDSFNGSDAGFWSMKANVSGIERQVKIGGIEAIQLVSYLLGIFAGSMTEADAYENITSEILNTFPLSGDINDGTMGANTIFSNITKSLTSYFRTATNATAQGSTQEWETHINTRWGFMIWPLVMVLLNSAFVIATSVQSHHRGIPSWRSSALASMFTDLCVEEQGTTTKLAQHVLIGPPEGLSRISDLEEWASTRLASLRV